MPKVRNPSGLFENNLFILIVSLCAGFCLQIDAHAANTSQESNIRVATYNIAMHRYSSGQLSEELRGIDSKQAAGIAEVIQRTRPDILLLCEFDYETDNEALKSFQANYLEIGQGGQKPIIYEHTFTAPSNTGEPTGIDMDKDGKTDGPADAFGYGYYPGQYGMAILSRYPIVIEEARTFRKFLWKDMPRAALPVDPDTGNSYYSAEQLNIFRLSSKSFWDIPILVKNAGSTAKKIHLLCSHPTPPVFDGKEDRNGCRNHDEIRMIADYIDPSRSNYLVDDDGKQGGIAQGESFVIAGDLNADPIDGDSRNKAITQLLSHPLVSPSPAPRSMGGRISSMNNLSFNKSHEADPEEDTADFSVFKAANLRADYVLASLDLHVSNSGIFWPEPNQPGAEASKQSDHRLVWIDIHWANE